MDKPSKILPKSFLAVLLLMMAFGIVSPFAPVGHAQPIQSIQFGTTVEILNTTSTGAVNGSTYALPTGAAIALTWQSVLAGGPSAISVSIQGSNDGTAWNSVATSTSTAGIISNIGIGTWRFIRAIQTSRTGGTSTVVTISAGRAFQVGSVGAGNISNMRVGVPGSLGSAPGIYGATDPSSGFYNFASGANSEWAVSFAGSAKMSWGLSGTSLYGPILAATDATHDIGSGSNRFRNLTMTGALSGSSVQPNGSALTYPSTTGVTAVSVGLLQTVTARVTVSSAAFTCAALTCDVVFANLPQRVKLLDVIADMTQVFACSVTCTTTTLTTAIGVTPSVNDVLASWDADGVVGQFGDADAELGSRLARATAVAGGSVATWASTGTLTMRLTSGTGNVGTGAATNLSQGSVTFYITYVRFG